MQPWNKKCVTLYLPNFTAVEKLLAVETRIKAKQLIDYVPDDKISTVIRYIQSFTEKKTGPSVNYTKKAAYEILLADVKPVTGKNQS